MDRLRRIIQVILIPVLIASCFFIILRPKSRESIVNCGLGLILILLVYSVVLYMLEMTDVVSSGWAFYSLVFFLIPMFVVLAILKAILLWNKRRM